MEVANLRLDLYTKPAVPKLDIGRGVLTRPATGARLLAIDETWLSGFVRAIQYETGDAASLVVRKTGRIFGGRLAQKLEAETASITHQALRSRPMVEFDFLIRDLFRGSGLGEPRLDWSYGKSGFIPVMLSHSPMGAARLEGSGTDPLVEGLIEGFIQNFASAPLEVVQTQAGPEASEDLSFIAAYESLLPRIKQAKLDGRTHSEIVQSLAPVR